MRETLTGPDGDLLKRSASGDRSAFAAFVERHQDSAYRLLVALTRDPVDAEDVLQETFLAAWRSAATFRGEASARAWILTIARNAVRRQQRRRVGEPAEFVSLDDLGRQAGWGSERLADSELTRLENRVLLERGLGRLSPDDREILILRDLEGFSGDEVSDMIGLTLEAAKSRLHRARLRLTAILKEELDAGA